MPIVWKEVIHVVASLVTIGVFLTGYAALPTLLGTEPSTPTPSPPEGTGGLFGSEPPTSTPPLSTGVLSSLSPQLKVAVVLVGAPLFNFIDTWFGISVAKMCAFFLVRLGIPIIGAPYAMSSPGNGDSEPVRGRLWGPAGELITNHIAKYGGPTMYMVAVVIVFPAVVGLNLAFQYIVFGNIDTLFPILLATVSVLATAVFYSMWRRTG